MYTVGLIIGRFQPFHKGHLYLMRKALAIASKLIVGVGSSNVVNDDNPIRYQVRRSIILTVFKRENLQDKLFGIVPIPDVPNDDEWLRITQKRVGSFDVSIGNNDWVNGIFRKAGIPVLEVPYFQRYLYEGQKIRSLMRNGGTWQGRVPDYLVSYITENLAKVLTPVDLALRAKTDMRARAKFASGQWFED